MDGLMSCVVCHGSYDPEKNIPKVLRCGHTHCVVCIKKIEVHVGGIRCPSCNIWNKIEEKGDTSFPTNFTLIQMLEQKKNEHGAFSFKCSECDVYGKPEDQHICVTCAKSNHKVTNLAEEIENIPGGIEALAVCASCAIKNHCQKKHEITELSALKIDYEYHQNIVEVKKFCKNLQEDNKKLSKKSNETKFLLESCRIECEHAISVMKTSRGHRNYALAWTSLKKSFEVLRNTYSYCNIKLAEVNARLVEGLPREALNLLEHKTHDHVTTRLRLDPITASMKFRLPGSFPVDQNIQVAEGEAEEPARSPTPAEDSSNDYDSPEEYMFREFDDVRRDEQRQMINIDSDGSDVGEEEIVYRPRRRWAGPFSLFAAHSLASMRDAVETARPANTEPVANIGRPDNSVAARRRNGNLRRRRRGSRPY